MIVKLISVSMFLILGGIVGYGFYRVFSEFSLLLHIVIGALGALFGMWLADLADIQLGGNVISSLLFSAIGAIILLTLNHLVRRFK